MQARNGRIHGWPGSTVGPEQMPYDALPILLISQLAYTKYKPRTNIADTVGKSKIK